MKISDLETGDHAYVLNGRQNSVFAARVTEIVGEDIHVYVPEKRSEQVYDRLTGKSTSTSKAILVPEDDWRAQVLLARKKFQSLHKDVLDSTKRFHRSPTPGNAAALEADVLSWREFTLSHPDPAALRANSIEEYEDLTNDS